MSDINRLRDIEEVYAEEGGAHIGRIGKHPSGDYRLFRKVSPNGFQPVSPGRRIVDKGEAIQEIEEVVRRRARR